MMTIEAVGQTDTGCVRSHNEDAFLLHRFKSENKNQQGGILAIVADGVGGHAGGRQASRTSVEKIREYLEQNLHRNPGKALVDAVEATHHFLKQMANENPSLNGMGTTCTAVWATGDEAYVAQVGDSRAYLFRNRTSVQITEDQTWVQKLFREGKIRAEDIPNHPDRNIILQALGVSDHVDVELFHLKIEPGDTLLLCSDGLHGLVRDREMVDLSDKLTPAETAKQLIDLARKRGGHDNITTVILKTSEGDNRTKENSISVSERGADTKEHTVFWTNTKRQRYWLSLLFILLGAALIVYLIVNLPINNTQKKEPAKEASQGIAESAPD